MKKTIALILVLICILALSVCLASCGFLQGILNKKSTSIETFSDWTSNGNGTHSRISNEDSSVTETEACSFGAFTVLPTCKEGGYTKYTCKLCAYSYTADRTDPDPDAHDLVFHQKRSATCLTDGWEAYYTCSFCDYTTYQEVPATGHDFSDWINYNENQHVRVCMNCDLRGFGQHDIIVEESVAATCTEKGKSSGMRCSVCDLVLLEQTETEVDPTNHTLETVEGKEPKCTEEGWDSYQRCIYCDYSNKTIIEPIGHSKSSIPSSDSESHYYLCMRCSEKLDLASHTIVIDPEKPRSCYEDGLSEGAHCSVCRYVKIKQVVLPQYGAHDLIDHDPIEASCSASGCNAYVTCSRCDFTTYEEIPALGHDPVFHVGKPVTCTELGYNDYYTCNRCTYSTYFEIPALGHSIKSESAKEPTCVDPGNEAYEYCERCSYTTIVEIPALGHQIAHNAAKDATCTEAGHAAYDTCSRCDYTTYEEIPALGHQKGALYFDENEHYFVCSRCSDSFDLAAHTPVEDAAVAANCSETGLTAGSHCSVCAYVIVAQSVVPTNNDHNITHHEGQAATCTEAGYKAYDTCSRCDYTTYEAIAATGHSLTHHNAVAATCTEAGYKAYDVCSKCDYTTFEEAPALGHLKGDLLSDETGHYSVCTRCSVQCDFASHTAVADAAVAANCSQTGLTAGSHCSVCAYVIVAQSVVPTNNDHNITHHEGQAATCTEAGYKAYDTCSRCDYTTYEAIAATGHSLTHYNAVAATCTEAGYKAYDVCSKCDYTTYEETPALGHDEVQHSALVPTCTESGHYAYVTCARCDYTTYQEVAALGHSIHSYPKKNPTCVESGHQAYEACARCGYTTREEIPALGHLQGINLYSNEGGHYYTCLRCSTEMSYTAHTAVADAAVAANCSQTGLTAGSHCSVCAYVIVAQSVVPTNNDHNITHHEGQAATCTQAGYEAYDTCSRCSYTTYQAIGALGHNLTHHDAVAATCTTAGHTAYDTCSRCDYTTYQTIAALGHQRGSIHSNADQHYYDCARCSVNFDYANHTPVTDAAVAATCTEPGLTAGSHCSVCAYVIVAQSVIPTNGSHDLIQHAAQAATCTEAGWSAYQTCSRCDYTTYQEIAALGHDYSVTSTTPATCIAYAVTHYACSRCDATYSETTGSSYAPHEYEAYTCKVCQREEMQDYLTKYNSGGSDIDHLIAIGSLRELALFYDYLNFYMITTPKYFSYPNMTTENMSGILAAASEMVTSQNWTRDVFYGSKGNNVTYLYASYTDSGDFQIANVCTVTPESGDYARDEYTQQDFVLIDKVGTNRANNFDDFPYKSRLYSVSVTTSDQLFYAFSHGYKPLPTAGSVAESILNAAKEINREIITDDMTDLQKAYAITQWIVANVEYDYGAIDASANGTINWSTCTAWYAEGVFDYHVAVCDGISKAVCILAGIEDMKCVRVTNETHAWNKFWIDIGTGEKQWYVLDATHANLGTQSKQELFSFENFLISDLQKFDLGYYSLNYDEASCSALDDTNPYALIHFGTGAPSEANDMVITSQSELNQLIALALAQKQNSTTSYLTLDIFFDKTYFATKTNCTDAIWWAIDDNTYEWYLIGGSEVVTYESTSGYELLIML